MKYRIKELCREKKMTLEKIAVQIGTTQTSLSRALGENGNPTIGTLQKIAEALNVELWELFTESKAKGELYGFVEFQNTVYKINSVQALQDLLNEVKKGEE